MKYLILNFKNAGWFPDDNKFSKDFYNDISCVDGYASRKTQPQYREPLTYHQVSGMLHVLFGERPKPSLRKTLFDSIDEITQLAKDSYFKIDTKYSYSDIDNKTKETKEFLIKELVREKKGVWNSFEKSKTEIYWNRINKYLGDDLYNQFVNILIDILKDENICDTPIIDVLNRLFDDKLNNDERILRFREILVKNKRKPFSDIISEPRNKDYLFELNKGYNTRITVNGGILNIIKLCGSIIVPINDSLESKLLNNSKGIAKLLDGGFVTIVDLIPSYRFDIDLSEYRKVGDISVEYK